MPRLDLNASKSERKRQLAELVAEHLRSMGHDATVLTGHLNASGHRDQVIVDSAIGLVHTTASVSTDPNGSILVSDIEDGSQRFLDGKDWVAYGWVDRSGRTLVQFVRAEHVLGRTTISKSEISKLSDRGLSVVYPA
jgi:hypothetical protein